MTSSPPEATPDPRACLLRLAPYLLGRTRRGVVGSSRYAQKLRDAIRAASADTSGRAVLISGEPGLEKDNLASLIHFGSSARKQLLVRINCAQLRPDGAELFGAPTGGVALIDCLGTGGLLLDQIDRADPALRPALLELARSGRWRSPDTAHTEHVFAGRVFLTAETSEPDFDTICCHIRVPPLRVRRQDLGEWLRYGVRQKALSLGWSRPPAVGEGLVKRLQTYDFPGNVRELLELIERALRQCSGANPEELPEDVFWTLRRPQRARFDLWRWKPQLRDVMRSPLLWNALLYGVVSWVFVLVNLWLWWGPQDRAHNGDLNLFWAWWWPLILLGYPLVGRLWCSFCPFMVWGEIVQRLATRLGWQPARWPRGDTDRWAAPLLAAGFAAILLWEELGDLRNSARQSSALLLLITAGAVVGSLRFENRFWCRHLCPVGGMNGLFAKLAISELRAEAGTCSGSCSSYACFKGGPAEGEGLATAGCPLGTHPAHLSDNRNCVLCLTCAQACPHRSVQLRLRPPAADLQRDMAPPAGEAGLILVLAGGVCLRHAERLLGWLPLAPDALEQGPLLARLAFAALALALPAGLWLLLRPLVAGLRPASPSWLLLYALLPLLWALLLAQHLPMGMAEGGLLLPVSAETLWPALAARLPSWSADAHVIAFCQSLTVLVGVGGSLLMLRRLLPLAVWSGPSLALGGLVVALGTGGRWLVAGG
ncbi:4Fe-4S binding protein [Synechococcus sp. FACHB-909]|uniref:4Fe-4S binding protein n=1 Tax=Synechococcus sp. FACHB-909 TaxID=2692863 RepID=UPI0016874A09|nr:4Fe-4S binding protein [Synechococcus sp. FACHB-909]MBD2717802.1 4Fe-4S binding protein [Synechococcus sp. FACHB-909]